MLPIITARFDEQRNTTRINASFGKEPSSWGTQQHLNWRKVHSRIGKWNSVLHMPVFKNISEKFLPPLICQLSYHIHTSVWLQFVFKNRHLFSPYNNNFCNLHGANCAWRGISVKIYCLNTAGFCDRLQNFFIIHSSSKPEYSLR